MAKVTSLLIRPKTCASAVGFVFGVRAQTEMKIWCITGMCILKVVSSETNLGKEFMGKKKWCRFGNEATNHAC